MLSRQIVLRSPIAPLTSARPQIWSQRALLHPRHYSDTSSSPSDQVKLESPIPTAKPSEEVKVKKKKTQAEHDQELLAKLQGHDSEGGDAGIEYEDGKPVSMKRSVKNNMFRYI